MGPALQPQLNEPRYWRIIGDTFRRERYRLWREHSDGVNLRLLDRWLRASPGELVLKTDLFDEAFGNGLYAAMQHRCRRVIGIDISTSILKEAGQGRSALSAVVADVRRLPFSAGVFDTIVSLSTLDHFESRAEISASLREMYAALRSGGRLILTLDNLANPKLRLRHALPWSILRRTGLVPYFVGASLSPRALLRELAEIGFKIEEITAVMHCPRVLGVAVSRLPLFARPTPRRRLLKVFAGFEVLSHLPSRTLTGHFVAVLARRSA